MSRNASISRLLYRERGRLFGGGAVLFCLVCFACPLGAGGAKNTPGYRNAPLFFEMFGRNYSDSLNLTLLPEGKIRVHDTGIEEVRGFDWVDHAREDLTWWTGVEDLRYLLPFLASRKPEHRRFAARWFEHWYEAHEKEPPPNEGAWDPLTAAFRGMVLVRYLKLEDSRSDRNSALKDKLRAAIRRHQQFLEKPENFEEKNNHGLWQALSLFELTRVFPDARLTELALERMAYIVEISVSAQGVHQEHSTHYHFEFLKWLSHYVAYFGSLGNFSWDDLGLLVSAEKRMREVSYFLYDHDYEIPQIGDTDAGEFVDAGLRSANPPAADVLFDKEAGLAFFKETDGTPFRRYVVFCIQNREHSPKLPHHFHNDLLAVYYNVDGETILGDQGRYSYARSVIMTYLTSLAAHNTILPLSLIVPRTPGIYLADRVWEKRESGETLFGATVADGIVKRLVRIPRSEPELIVDDTIEPTHPYILLWNIGHDVASIEYGGFEKNRRERVYKWALVTKKQRRYAITIRVTGKNTTSEKEAEIVKGQNDPPLGWYSPSYNVLIPSPVIKITLHSKKPIRVSTRVRSGG